jgi:hypothetical protein
MTKKSTYVFAVFVAATISYLQPYFPYFIDSASYSIIRYIACFQQAGQFNGQ